MNKLETVEKYLDLNYTITLRRDNEGDFVARISELDGCISHGSNPGEAVANLRAMQTAWIEDCLESGQAVPLPGCAESLPSGKWVQRVPRSLHERLVELAQFENVSLNQLVTAILADGVAYRLFCHGPAAPPVASWRRAR